MGTYETLKELENYKLVLRQIWDKSGRQESDPEHSWQVAMMLITLAPNDINLSKALPMALIHDLPEIYTGDVCAFDVAGRVGKHEREKLSAERIFGLIGMPSLHALWQEYELKETPEARVVQALDKLEPVLHNIAHGGITWIKKDLSLEEVLAKKRPYWHMHPSVTPLYEAAFKEAQEKGLLK